MELELRCKPLMNISLVLRSTFGDVKCGWRTPQACRDKCGSACGKGIERENMSSAPRSPLWNISSLSGGRGVKVGESLWSGSFVGARIRRATGSNFNNQWKSWEVSKKSKRRKNRYLALRILQPPHDIQTKPLFVSWCIVVFSPRNANYMDFEGG